MAGTNDPTAQYGTPQGGFGGSGKPDKTLGVTSDYNPWTTQTPYQNNPNLQGPPPQVPKTSLGTDIQSRKYVDGDQLGPANESPQDIKALQMQMVAAGILDPNSVHWGVWDIESQKAYTVVLSNANVYGAKAPDMLDWMQKNAPKDPTGTKRLPAYQVTNPANITAAVNTLNTSNVAQQTIGMNLPQGETNDFVKWYQDQETSARDAYNKATLAGNGASVTGPPSLDAAAQAYIKQHNLDQAVAYGTAARMFQFFGMLNGPGKGL